RRDVAELDRRGAKRHAAPLHPRAREMHLGDSGRAHQGRCIVGRDATSGQHADAAGRLPHQPGNRVRALGRGGRLAGAEHALHPECDERLERPGRVAAHVERAVKRHVQWPRGGDQLAGPVHIDLPVGAQHARHDALRAGLLGPLDVLEHHRELGRRVEEVSAARPDEHEDRDVEPRPADRERTRGGRRAALDQVGAQLEAVRAATRGGERGLDGVDAGFDEDGSGHGAKIMEEFLLLRPAGASIEPMTARPEPHFGIVQLGPFAGFVQRFEDLIGSATAMALYFIHSRRWRENHDAAIKAFLGRPGTTLEVFLPDLESHELMFSLGKHFEDGPLIPALVADAYRYFARLARDFAKPAHIWLFDRYPTYSFYRFDDRAVIALYSNTSAKKELPAFELTAGGVLGTFLAADMDDLKKECRKRASQDLEVVIANAAP